jgi:YD repeat-containing protein
MQFSLRALFLAILSVSISALWASNSQAEYWSHPFIGKCRDSGFACARKVSIAVYGADQTFSRCNYIRADYYGYLVMAECKGSRGWGMVNLNCESGEVKSTNGCISAPIVDKDPPCESQAGNPVDASSGMKLEYVLDFTTAGPLPLKFERHYRSETNTRDGEYKTSRLGTGWRSNFDGAMFYYSTSSHPSSSLRFVLPDGTFYSFKTSNGAYVQRYYSWTKKEWVNQSVNRSAKAAWNSSAQRYELTTPDDTLWSFDTSARLRSITYRGGYAQVLDYDSSGNNTSVTDSFGRSLTFTYSSKGLLQTMRTPDGMTYAYGYAIRYFEDYAPYLSESSTEAAEFFALKSVPQWLKSPISL